MVESPIRIFNIKYQTDGMDWDASILAYSKDEAMKTIRSLVPGIKKVFSIGASSRVDAISPRVINKIMETYSLEKKSASKMLNPNEDDQEMTEEDGQEGHKCEFCDKVYKTAPALKAHLTRDHKKK